MVQLWTLIAVVTLSSGLVTAWNERCKEHSAAGNCDFYRGCVETHAPCGEVGYALAFGEKYCRRFNNYSTELMDDRAS